MDLRDDGQPVSTTPMGAPIFEGADFGFHCWRRGKPHCERCGLTYRGWAEAKADCTGVTWLDELTAAWGKPRATAAAIPTKDGKAHHRVWVWHPGLVTHLVVVDVHPAGEGKPTRWQISASAYQAERVQSVAMVCTPPGPYEDNLPHANIRSVLVAAGWLE